MLLTFFNYPDLELSYLSSNFALRLRGNGTTNPSALITQRPTPMLSNATIALAFNSQKPASNLNMESNGNVLYSYSTAIMQHTKIGNRNVLIVNRTKYSCTTSKQVTTALSAILAAPKRRFSKIVEVKGVPMGTYDLTRYVQTTQKKAA